MVEQEWYFRMVIDNNIVQCDFQDTGKNQKKIVLLETLSILFKRFPSSALYKFKIIIINQ